ncbi:MAG: tetratricopeptide repeat protein [Verrucomicrobiales bacterium]|nr:tetratricopeptide repeat protein [Verrucomicrobiales bacterium]
MRYSIHSLLLACSLAAFLPSLLPAHAQDSSEKVASEPNTKAKKYHSALLRRPSGGYLFDRFFNAWLDTDTIDGMGDFLKKQNDAKQASTADHLLYGYFLIHQGQESQALTVFESALKSDPKNTATWTELAKARARSLDFDQAIKDLDQALLLKPKKQLAIQLGKLKGRWLSRSGKNTEAIAAWNDLLKQHPKDNELREDLVDLQLAEGLIEEAIKTQITLIEATSDAYQKITRKLRLGDIYLRSGKSDQAKTTYSESLKSAGRDTWLEKEILAQIENLFRRENDLEGLKKYYSDLAKKEKGRIAILRRHALILAELEESDEAIAVFQGILKMTPGDRSNRETYVALLGKLGKAQQAVEQIELLVAAEPDDSELLTQLATWQNEAGQQDAALASIQKYLKSSDKSEYSYLRAARLLEQFKQQKPAAEIFAQLTAAFPDSISVQEEQAAFFYRSDKKEAAIAIWKKIAEQGSDQDAIRAARLLSSHDQRELAYQILKKRVEEFSTDFVFLGRLCEEAIASKHAEEALPWMKKRIALATAPIDFRDALRQAINILDRAKKLDSYRQQLLAKKDTLDASQSCLLAELLEKNSEYDLAQNVLQPWMDKGNLLALHQRSRQLELRKEWEKAAAVTLKLIELPKGRRSTNLQHLVQLYRNAQKNEDALKWIEEWKKISPGSSQPWLEQAQVLSIDGKGDEAIQILRKAVARFEDEETPRTLLASYYQQQGKTADALRIYWSLYEQSEDIGAKLRWVSNLSSVAQQQGKVDQLIEQFEERRRANRKAIAPLLAIAEIHRRSGDYEGRRAALLEATRLRPEDLSLLKQIARIEEQEGNWERAVQTLESALPLDKTDHIKRDIALLHLRYGDEEEGYRQFMQLQGGSKMDADTVLAMADGMIARSGWQRAIQLLEAHRERFPDDYRIAYLRAVALEESGEEEKAIQAFLQTLDFDKEIAKLTPQAQTRMYSNYAAAYQAQKESIKGLYDLYQMQNSYWGAYQYRQQLQSGRIRFQSNFGNQNSSLITLPTSLSVLGTQALAHLHQLSKLFYSDDEPIEKNKIAIGLKQREFKNVELLLAIPLNNPYSPGTQVDIALLDRFPDSDALHAMAITSQMNLMTNRQGHVDLELLTRCYNKLLKKHPTLSYNAAIIASASGEKEAFAMLREALAQNSKDDSDEAAAWASMLPHIISYLLLNHADENFPDDLKKPLMAKLRDSRTKQIEANKKAQGINPLLRFNPGDAYVGILRKQKDLSEFATYLDQQCSEYNKVLNDPKLKSNISSLGGLAQYLTYSYSSQPAFHPLSFPPAELPDIAPNVLSLFAKIPNYNFGGNQNPITPEQAKQMLQQVSDPLLKLFLLDLSENQEATGKQIEQLLSNTKKGRERLPLKESLLGAAWYQKTEQWAKSAELLEAIRLLPMDAALRRRIDALVVLCAKEAGIEAKTFQDKNSKGLAKWGSAAALRLRYGTLSTRHRAELIAVLEEFGFKGEAKQLENKKIAQTQRGSYVSPTQSVGAKGVQEKIDQLLKDNKNEQAEKLLSRTIDQNLRSITSTGNVRWDYNLLNLINHIRRKQPEMLDKIFQQSLPSKESKPSDLLRYAAMMEMNVNFKEAAKYYDLAFATMSKSSQKKYIPRLAIIKGTFDPEAGAKLMQQIDTNALQQFSQLINTVLQPVDYSSGNSQRRFDARIQHTRMFTAWLNANQGNKKIARSDLSWVIQNGLHTISANMHPLPSIYQHDRYGLKSKLSEENQNLAKPRLHAYNALCKAMIKHPQLARKAFSSLASVRIGKNPTTAFEDKKLTALAQAILTSTTGNNSILSRNNSFNWVSLRENQYPLWTPEEYLIQHSLLSKKDPQEIQKIIDLASKSKDRNQAKLAKTFAAMKTCEAQEFAKAIQNYLTASSANNNFRRNNFSSSTTDVAYSAAYKAFATWEDRREAFADTFDMEDYLIKAIKKSRLAFNNEPLLLAADYTQWLNDNKGWQVTEAWLLKLTQSWIGEPERWGKFKKQARRKVPTGNGSYYYQGGQFTDQSHQQYAGFLQRVGYNPSIVFNLVSFLEKNGLDFQKQISQDTVISRLSASNFTQNSDLVLSIFNNSPLINDASSFRSGEVQSDRDPLFKRFLDESRRWKKEDQAKLEQLLTGKNTFGSKLALAYLKQKSGGDKNKQEVIKFLGSHKASIDAMPEINKTDLATLLVRFYPKGVPVDGLNKDALAVIDNLGASRAKSAVEKAEEFLLVKKLSSLGIHNSEKLHEKIGPMLDPLLESGRSDLMEKVYWHAIDFAVSEQKKGTWQTARNIPWRLNASFLFRLLHSTSGGGMQRIAFYQRVIENDKKGVIGVSYMNSKFTNILISSFKQAGGKDHMEKALSKVAADMWELTKSQHDHTLAGLIWNPLFYHFSPEEMPRAIAWADKYSEGESWSPLAKEIAMCWRLIMNITTKRVTQPYWKKVSNLGAWQDHYLTVINDESLSVTYRMNVAHTLCGAKTGMLKDKTIYRSTELLVEAMLGEHPSMSWSFAFIIREFCLLPKTEEWTTLAAKVHEAWVFANRNNIKGYQSGVAWIPYIELVLRSLELHCRLGDEEKLALFRKEKNVSGDLITTARTIFCLVQYGFLDQALEELNRGTDLQDISTDYREKKSYYQAYYDSRVHENLPKFLAKIKEPGLKYFAEILILGAFDLPKEKKEKDPVYLRRSARLLEAAKRFTSIDFEGDETLKANSLRQFDIYDHNIFYLRKELAAHFAKADFGEILNSGNYRRVEYDIRVLSSHANNRLREQDLKPVRQFLQFLSKSTARDYYQRKALEHFSLRIASSVPFRSHHAMTPDNLQSHADALHLLLAIPDHKLMSHSGLQKTAISKVAADILLGQFPEVKSQLEASHFNEARSKLLGKGIYKNSYSFWRPMTVVMRFKDSNPKFKPDTKERQRRVEAFLAHPIIIEALKNKKDLDQTLIHNTWITKEELDSKWGKKLMQAWKVAHAPKS